MSLAGHFWTLAPSLWHRVRPAAAPASIPWSTLTRDAKVGAVRLSGELCERPESDTMVVIVHGLGGATQSHYCVRAAQHVHDAGMSSLRIALRGADRLGEDFYHSGLATDVEAAFASPELARYKHLLVLGYSLGGHVTVHAALRRADPRLRAVAAVCAPLDLQKSSRAIDDPSLFVYRGHVLKGLNEIYCAVAARKAVPTDPARVLAAKTIREWDSLTVVPRYGFSDVNEYYDTMSAGSRLADLQCPTLLLPSRHDPMVPPWSIEDAMQQGSAALSVQWIDQGGHVGYPPRVRVRGRSEPLEAHALRFLRSHC